MDEKKKKHNKKANQDEDVKEAQKEVEQMLKDIEDEFGVGSNVKVIKVKLPKRDFKSVLSDSLLNVFLNFLFIFSISGYIQWTETEDFLKIGLFILIFSLIEVALRVIIYVFFPKTLVKTLGTILMLVPLLAILITTLFTHIVVIRYTSRLLLMFFLLYVFKGFARKFIERYRR